MPQPRQVSPASRRGCCSWPRQWLEGADYLQLCRCVQVDICLYLLPPRQLAASDATFLRRLASHVAVLPVLARADALPVMEAAAIRESAAEQLYRQPLAKRKAAGEIWLCHQHVCAK